MKLSVYTWAGGGAGQPGWCYEIVVLFMISFILNMIWYANAACDSLIKSICYNGAKRHRWDYRITGRVRQACGFVIRHHLLFFFFFTVTLQGARFVCVCILHQPSTPLLPQPLPPKCLHNSPAPAVCLCVWLQPTTLLT